MNQRVYEALYEVIDPELGINIVDLGLIYGVDVDEDNNVLITMTLTTPGCPLHDSIENGVRHRVGQVEDINQVDINIVWEPKWEPSKMSESAKAMLWY